MIHSYLNSIEKQIQQLSALKRQCNKLGLIEMKIDDLKIGMIIFAPKEKWSEVGQGWLGHYAFPRHYEKYSVIETKSKKVQNLVFRKIGSKTIYDAIETQNLNNYVWVLEKSIKK